MILTGITLMLMFTRVHFPSFIAAIKKESILTSVIKSSLAYIQHLESNKQDLMSWSSGEEVESTVIRDFGVKLRKSIAPVLLLISHERLSVDFICPGFGEVLLCSNKCWMKSSPVFFKSIYERGNRFGKYDRHNIAKASVVDFGFCLESMDDVCSVFRTSSHQYCQNLIHLGQKPVKFAFIHQMDCISHNLCPSKIPGGTNKAGNKWSRKICEPFPILQWKSWIVWSNFVNELYEYFCHSSWIK